MSDNEWELKIINPNLIKLSGSLTFANAAFVKKSGEKLIDQVNQTKIDLADLKKIDSSCLSLLVAWLRYAKTRHKILEFINLPAKLMNLSRVSGIDEILPIRT